MATPRPTLRSWVGLVALVAAVWGATQALQRWQDVRAASAIREHSLRVEVTLYTTTHCPYCAKARAWLTQEGARWQECNVETDTRCASVYRQQGSPGVPLVRAGDRWHLGFNPAWLAEALATQDAKAQGSKPSGPSSPRP